MVPVNPVDTWCGSHGINREVSSWQRCPMWARLEIEPKFQITSSVLITKFSSILLELCIRLKNPNLIQHVSCLRWCQSGFSYVFFWTNDKRLGLNIPDSSIVLILGIRSLLSVEKSLIGNLTKGKQDDLEFWASPASIFKNGHSLLRFLIAWTNAEFFGLVYFHCDDSVSHWWESWCQRMASSSINVN
jgi:hypothetical protein